MRVDARPGVFLGTHAGVTPSEAHLWVAVLVLASGFSSTTFGESSHAREMILHGLFSVGEVLLAPDKVVDKFPDTSVVAYWIVYNAVVPEQVLDVELVVRRSLELQCKEVHQPSIIRMLSHLQQHIVPFVKELLDVSVLQCSSF